DDGRIHLRMQGNNELPAATGGQLTNLVDQIRRRGHRAAERRCVKHDGQLTGFSGPFTRNTLRQQRVQLRPSGMGYGEMAVFPGKLAELGSVFLSMGAVQVKPPPNPVM